MVEESKSALQSAQAELALYLVDINDVATMLGNVNEQADSITRWIGPTTLGFLGLVTLFFSLYVVAVLYACCDKSHACFEGFMGCFAFPLTILGLLLVMVMCAVVCALGIVSADFCVDPDNTTLALVRVHSTETNYGAAEYYVQCSAGSAANPFLAELEQVQQEVQEVNDGVTAGRAILTASCDAGTDAALDTLVNSTGTCLREVTETIALILCDGITPLYVSTVHAAYCTDMYGGTVDFFGGVCFASLLLLAMLSFRSVYGTEHGDDEGGGDQRAAELAGMSSV